jgi:hypothetical protein
MHFVDGVTDKRAVTAVLESQKTKLCPRCNRRMAVRCFGVRIMSRHPSGCVQVARLQSWCVQCRGRGECR